MTPVANAPSAVEPVAATVASPPEAATPPPEVNAAPRYDAVSSTTTADAPRASAPVEFTPITAADAERASAPAPVSTTRVPESASAPINASSIAAPVTFKTPVTEAPSVAGSERPASETLAPQPVATTGKKSKKAKSDKTDSDANTKVASNPPTDGGFAGLQFGNSKSPIDIKSESMSLDYEHHAILWTGHVHANQANAQLTSDKLHVNYFDKDFKQMKDIVAEGNVRISQGTRWATGDHGVMDQTKHTMVLTGSPVVHDGTDQITGSKITVYLDNGRSVVEGAHAVIFPHQADEADNSPTKSAPAEQQ
jgi:lipopolysaccharide export system protein LptA